MIEERRGSDVKLWKYCVVIKSNVLHTPPPYFNDYATDYGLFGPSGGYAFLIRYLLCTPAPAMPDQEP